MAFEGHTLPELTRSEAGAGARQELAERLAAAAAELDTWVQQRQPLLFLVRLVSEDATTAAEMSAIAHQARALVEQAQAMVQQLRALREQVAATQ